MILLTNNSIYISHHRASSQLAILLFFLFSSFLSTPQYVLHESTNRHHHHHHHLTSPSTQPQPQPQIPPNTRPGGTAPFLPGNTLLTRFTNFYRMAIGSMSPHGQAAYWHDADLRYESLDCTRCESQRDYLLQYSPIIRFLSSHIEQLGGSWTSRIFAVGGVSLMNA